MIISNKMSDIRLELISLKSINFALFSIRYIQWKTTSIHGKEWWVRPNVHFYFCFFHTFYSAYFAIQYILYWILKETWNLIVQYERTECWIISDYHWGKKYCALCKKMKWIKGKKKPISKCRISQCLQIFSNKCNEKWWNGIQLIDTNGNWIQLFK